jgi:hypothetical protein
MPELALSYIVGGIAVFICVNWNLVLLRRRYKNKTWLQLNHNLEKINKFWSLNQGRIIDAQPQIKELDQKAASWSFFIFGTMLMFLSWFGFIFFWIYWLSLNKFAVSREEKRLFKSELALKNVDSKNEIEKIISLLELPE